MNSSLIVLIVALIAVAAAWKVLKGIVKTIALVVILLVAGIFVFGGSLA